VVGATKTQVIGDFHMTTYEDALGNISEFEMFTKQPDKEVYLGLSCTDMSPFPTLKIVLLGDNIISTLSKNYIEVNYKITTKTPTNIVPLVASLKSTYKNKSFSNEIRLELDRAKIKNMSEIQNLYSKLLNDLKQGSAIIINLSSQEFDLDKQQYKLSLEGFKQLLTPYEAICR
jgi:hypothetical protein